MKELAGAGWTGQNSAKDKSMKGEKGSLIEITCKF